MTKLTVLFGGIFAVIGIVAFVATGSEQATALIPAYFGAVLIVLGKLGDYKESWRKHVMHVALLVALLGVLGSIGGLFRLIGSLFGGELERPAAVYAQSAFALAAIAYIGAGVRSFIQARRAREQGE